MKYLFLKKDSDCLKKEQEELLKIHQKIGKDLGEACRQSSETWHDNAVYDDALGKAKLVEERLMKIGDILERVKVVEIPYQNNKVEIGHTVRFVDEDNQEKIYKIGSYVCYDDSITYNTPVASCLLNKKVGDICLLKIGDKEKQLKILEIN
ncbi:MAG: GreA/GreB family elongation factor [Patescibacteria group bacterium]